MIYTNFMAVKYSYNLEQLFLLDLREVWSFLYFWTTQREQESLPDQEVVHVEEDEQSTPSTSPSSNITAIST